VRAAIALVIAVFGVFELPVTEAASRQRSAIIDRTMVCRTALAGGAPDRVRTLKVSVSELYGSEPSQFDPSIQLNTGGSDNGAALVSVRSQVAPRVHPYLLFNTRLCSARARLRLGGETRMASPIDFNTGCTVLDASRQVVVRVRATMDRPTRLSAYRREYLRAPGKALEAFMVVRTHPGRKLVAFASFGRDGAGSFFRSASCTE
jgi:hypothetical protein